MAGILFIISAPSGSGKSTLVSQLRTLVEGLDFSISYTTRAPRGSETDGREYHFTTRADFERMIAAGDFLEWAEVFGNYYGTAVSALDHARVAGKDLLLDIDVQGAVQVMKKLPKAVSIFILPPSPQVLEMRLRNRSEAEHVTSEAVIQSRLAEARNELITPLIVVALGILVSLCLLTLELNNSTVLDIAGSSLEIFTNNILITLIYNALSKGKSCQ